MPAAKKDFFFRKSYFFAFAEFQQIFGLKGLQCTSQFCFIRSHSELNLFVFGFFFVELAVVTPVAELIFGATDATNGRVNFFENCVIFLEKQRKMLYNSTPK